MDKKEDNIIKEEEEEEEEDLSYDEEEDNFENEGDEDEDYEEMTEEQLDELNRLSMKNRLNDPFGMRPAPSPVKHTGPTLAELMAIAAQQPVEVAPTATQADDDGDWIGEDELAEDDDEAILKGMETMTLSHAKRTATHLVIDTNAIIASSTRFDTIAKVLWTVEEVLEEVKDSRTADYLATLPYEIKVKEPSAESIRAVIAFSKLTGDFPSLSNVDLKVLALTHTLHSHYDSESIIKTEPGPLKGQKVVKPTTTPSTTPSTTTAAATTESSPSPSTTNNKNNNKSTKEKPVLIIRDTTSKFSKKKTEKKNKNNNNKKNNNKSKKPTEPVKDTCCDHTDSTPTSTSTPDKTDTCCSHDHHDHDHKETTTNESTTTTPTESTPSTEQNKPKKNKKKNSLMVNLDELEDDKPIVDGRAILEQMKLQKQLEEEERRKNKRALKIDDEEDGWITPDNIRDKLEKGNKATEKKHVKVACITSDFSMQNTMLQMGLNLFTVNGLKIKKVNQFVLKCYSCQLTTTDMKTMWCQSCGNKTMVKAMKMVDKNGNVIIGKGSGRQFNLRGKKYSIPKMRGGQKHTDIVLSEEQYIHRMKATGLYYRKRAHEKKLANAIENGDLERFETVLGLNPGDDVTVGYGKINPNIARRSIGKKNKSILNR